MNIKSLFEWLRKFNAYLGERGVVAVGDGTEEGEEGGEAKPTEGEEELAEQPKIKVGEKEYTQAEIEAAFGKSQDYDKKTQELSEREESLADVIALQKVLAKNPDKLEKIIAVLEDKSDAARAAGDQRSAGTLDALIDKLNESDTTQGALKLIAQTVKRLEKFVNDSQMSAEESSHEAAVQSAQKVLKKSLDEYLADKNIDLDDDEKAFLRQRTMMALRATKKNWQDDEEFAADVKAEAKKQYEKMKGAYERRLKKYIASKGGTPPVNGGDGAPAGKEKKITMDNLSQALEDEFTALEEK